MSVRDGESVKPRVVTGKRDELAGKFGMQHTSTLEDVCCPQCGLVRLCADHD